MRPVEAPPALDQALQGELGGEIALRQAVGRGPLTVTYAGIESRQGRPVHVHVVPPDLARADPERAQRLLHAARITARLRHPRVASIYRVAAGDRLCWYVTPANQEQTLATLLAREPKMPLPRVAEIVGHVAGALACAHEYGAVHAGLAPDQVLIDAEGAASVRGFGMHGADDPAALPYRAPELDAQPPAPHSAVTDQYALAVMAFQMLAGTLPFVGTGPEEMQREHRETAVPPLALACPELPPAVATVIERAMAKRPGDRFPSIVKFAHGFRSAALGRASGAFKAAGIKRQSNVLLPPAGEPAAPASLAPPAAGAPRQARRPVLLGALGVGTLLAVLALIAWQSQRGAMSAAEQQRLTARSRLLGHAYADPAPTPPSAAGAVPGSTSTATAPAPAPDQPSSAEAQPQPRRDDPPRAARRETPRRGAPPPSTASAAVGYITVGTNPQAAIFINEQLVPSNPVRNWPVRPGAVFLRFQVMDTVSGVWTQDMTVNLRSGDTLNLRRVRLVHP